MVPDQSNPPFPIAGHEWVPETTTWIGPLPPISISLSSFPSSQSFFEVQVNTSVILCVVAVLLVLEFWLLRRCLEGSSNNLHSEFRFSNRKNLQELVWLFQLVLLGCPKTQLFCPGVRRFRLWAVLVTRSWVPLSTFLYSSDSLLPSFAAAQATRTGNPSGSPLSEGKPRCSAST